MHVLIVLMFDLGMVTRMRELHARSIAMDFIHVLFERRMQFE